jgi:hypothetical protein
VNVLNKYASQFYDTPAAQISKQAVGAQPTEAETFWSRFKDRHSQHTG